LRGFVVGLERGDLALSLPGVPAVVVRPGGRIATTLLTPPMYLNVYRASSRASRRSSSSRADVGVPTPIAQFVPPMPQRLKATVLPVRSDTALELALGRTAT
jgi:hypothetical protein